MYINIYVTFLLIFSNTLLMNRVINVNCATDPDNMQETTTSLAQEQLVATICHPGYIFVLGKCIKM